MPQQSDNDVSIDDISDNEYSDAVEESDMDPDEKQLDCSEDNNKEGDVDNDEEFNPSDDAGDDYDIRPARKKQKLSGMVLALSFVLTCSYLVSYFVESCEVCKYAGKE